MNVYSDKYLKQWEVREGTYRDRKTRNEVARILRKDGWEVTTKTFSFDGVEYFTFDARKRRVK